MNEPDVAGEKSEYWIETWEDTTGWRARAMRGDREIRRCGIAGAPDRLSAATACAEKADRRYGILITVLAPIAADAAAEAAGE